MPDPAASQCALSKNIKLLVIATKNAKKAGEMEQILKSLLPNIDLRNLADFPGAPEPEETGQTYAENALIKARSSLKATGEWSLADDAGLEIDALPGDLGVHSKRFEGEETNFDEKMRIILDRMEGLPDDKRSARFRCDVALVGPDGTEFVIEDVCEGRIAEAPSGNGGFGYDPIFYLPELDCTMAELSAEQKHEVSHRGKVLRRLADCLQDA